MRAQSTGNSISPGGSAYAKAQRTRKMPAEQTASRRPWELSAELSGSLWVHIAPPSPSCLSPIFTGPSDQPQAQGQTCSSVSWRSAFCCGLLGAEVNSGGSPADNGPHCTQSQRPLAPGCRPLLPAAWVQQPEIPRPSMPQPGTREDVGAQVTLLRSPSPTPPSPLAGAHRTTGGRNVGRGRSSAHLY